jgi:hypothetical protein
MKIFTFTFAAAVAICIVGSLATGSSRAQADDVFTTCPAFTGHAWVNPYPPHNGGTTYQLGLSGKGVACAFAATWSKKFTAQHFKIGKDPFASVHLTGPAGWKCHSGLDQNGFAYQGACTKDNSMVNGIFTTFNWSPNK